MKRSMLFAAALAVTSQTAIAQDAPDPQVDEAVRSEVVGALAEAMIDKYVFPDKGEETAAALREKAATGTYRSHATARAFADALRTDLREAGNDRHLQVRFIPGFAPPPEGADPNKHTPEEVEEMQREMAANGFGIFRTMRLPGNVGYLDVRFFGPPEGVAPAYEAAMQLLDGSDALIIDLRANGGGDPASVAQLVSHLFAKGDVRHINSIYERTQDRTREFWTNQSVATRYIGPLFVLTSSYTFSGGEEFAYDIQTQERGTLVGETTGGGANPGMMVPLGHGFAAFIPTGRAINPVTGTNWEHVGVKPDIAVDADQAMTTAIGRALAAIREANPDRAEDIAGVEARLAEGKLDLPGWKDPSEGR
ncbi:S41 family peptidase [Qipengyuania seohaensis]|uniref:S41 family peptidase n=1 Tax=Qipengyuania seohaensis TaxID=266951 RepID=UPI000C2229D4|nr:S41 family peptidase [Qipengyuania seohaensis]